MPTVDFVIESELSTSTRVRQVSSMFDCPVQDKCRLEYHIEFPLEAQPWNVGLIVGPSGSGKSTVMRHVFGAPVGLDWRAKSVVEDFTGSLQDVVEVCGAVGFNTIPAWMRPQTVLSTGEKFRVDLARRLLEVPDPIVVDEFTSVVDRQVAQIGSHAVQKYIRKHGRKFVAVSCHYDIIDWLQPDWVLDMSTRFFTRRLLQRRPTVECVVGRLPYAAWRMFAPYHYLTSKLHFAARCFGLWADGRLAAFAGMHRMPHPTAKDIMALWRLVTLPDWQGLGLAFVLTDNLAAAYKAIGERFHSYPAHPSLIRSFDRSPKWRMVQRPGSITPSTRVSGKSTLGKTGMGSRPCAVFLYVGPAMNDKRAAELLIGRG